MSSRPKRRPEPCNNENCGSRRFHQGEDGYTYCDQGHQQSDRGAAVVEDTGELVLAGRKHRRVDSDAESMKTGRTFEGSKAVEYYLIALQVVLRKQVQWLVDEAKVSGEIEGIVRELWALRLRKVQFRDGYESGTDTEGQSQLFSSQSEGESGTETNASQNSRRKASTSGIATLVDTLALCYIATLLLRLPITIADFIRLADKGSLPYYQAIILVQKSLTEKLPGQYQSLLEPQSILKAEDLQRRVFDTAKQFHEDFGMSMPAVNHPLVLYRWMRTLALPIEVFAATTRLARMLGLDFGFLFEGVRRSDFPLRYPEARLMALLVVATKLLFPCDDHERHPASAQDMSALRMDWDAWQKSQSSDAEEFTKPELMSHSDAFAVTDTDCLSMGDEDLDRYLDWYQNNLASETVREQGRAGKEADFRRTMMGLFPARLSVASTTSPVLTDKHLERKDEISQRLGETQAHLTSLSIVLEHGFEDAVTRTGAFYKRHREVSELAGPISVLYEKASKLGGTSVSGMVKATFAVELRLEKIESRMRKEEAILHD
ncbi:hypothetical protein B0A48_16195 [Cryoendolithus antarcticus]|uniref:Uncharacterized protein n=1 Tax=Cryoendolithus antarcticus TaxID=1507870 RepID=A0A1V8SFE8_9PEZI|nr:hypothetical protein B0A48_16195 [Cryoendolithus antarcticus]